MLHLAFVERALLGDEMGLGKTIQAIAACALLHHLGKAQRVLIVTPASLKAEWEEQILKFTTLDQRIIFGPRLLRSKYFADINARLRPDIVVLDDAQRIKNHDCQDCPKLDEFACVLDEAFSDPDLKIIVFSEWEGMLKKVRDWANQNFIGHAWQTGKRPQQKRRGEILAFLNDADCRLFLSTDSGGVGLNLQHASVVINCDLPWNPARLEQRIARAWRKNQKRPVTVVNLIAADLPEEAELHEHAANKALDEAWAIESDPAGDGVSVSG